MQKILFFDIETSPNCGWTWEKYEQDVISFEKQRELLSFAYKWQDGKIKVESKRTNTERQLLLKLHKLFNEADIIIGHNAQDFDCKMANSFFVHDGLKPPSPYKIIDTLKIARSKFRFNSNKLDDLGEYLGFGRKIETGGFKLWLQCIKGNRNAWRKMEKYNKQDVVLLARVYEKLAPWVKTPELNINGLKCPFCSSTNVIKRGWALTRVFKRQRWVCKNCGRWSASNQKVKYNNEPYLKNV